MERKIGDVFTFDGKQLEVIEGNCWDCYFNDKSCCLNHPVRDIIGEFYASYRRDCEDVCYKLIEE